MKNVTEEYHTTQYVAQVMREELQIPGQGHDIGDEFDVGNIHVRLTPAWHNWQNEHKKWQYRFQRRSARAEKSNCKSGQIACACAGRGVHIE